VTGDEARAKLRATLDAGGTIIGAGAGTGLSAKCAEMGGTDLIIIYNSGRYRMAGRGSLAGSSPTATPTRSSWRWATRCCRSCATRPVLAGVCGTDPVPAHARTSCARCATPGFAGVQNFPTVGLIDGTFRANLEETGMSYALEVEMIREAAALGLLTSPYVFDPGVGGRDGAGRRRRARAAHGPDHEGHDRRADRPTLDDCVGSIQAMRDAAVAVNPDVIVLCHGGPARRARRTRSTCSTAPRGSSASSARRAWSACRPRSR
jgi:predicted TIM-barrel enzyme